MSEIAYIALGSNLGEPSRILQQAIEQLAHWSVQPLARSSFWQTSPVNCPANSPWFVNAAVALWPADKQTPENLLQQLQRIEREFGRVRKQEVNAPRPLDLDLIAYGQRIVQTSTLTLPHPRAHLRQFVLQPLAEIAPDLVLPGQAKSVKELLAGLATSECVRRIPG